MNVNRFLAACGIAMACVNASAAQVVITTTGVFTSGSYDKIGIFAQPDTDLAGVEYQIEMKFDKDLAESSYVGEYGNSVIQAPASYSLVANGVVVFQPQTNGRVDVFLSEYNGVRSLYWNMAAGGPTSSIGKGLTFWGEQNANFPGNLLPDYPRLGMSLDYQLAPVDLSWGRVLFYNWDFIPRPDGDAEHAYSALNMELRHVSMSVIPEPSSNVLVGLGIAGAVFITRRSRNSRALRRSFV